MFENVTNGLNLKTNTESFESDSSSDENVNKNIDEQDEMLPSRAGVTWKRITGQLAAAGRAASRNILRQIPGLTSYAQHGLVRESPLSAFRLFIDEPMLRSIQKYTVLHGKSKNNAFCVSIEDLEKFIGLTIARGVTVSKNTPIKHLWNKGWGPPLFKNTMTREKYESIMKHMRFDDLSNRRQRRETDKFCLISATWDKFICNCKLAYVLHGDITIDEQLFPCKTCYAFIQYMASKPDKFGIKFWCLVDSVSKYLYNIAPYLGKDISRDSRIRDLPAHVCLKLLDNLLNKCYNLTTDSFFTSSYLANELLQKNTTIVGIIRKQTRNS